jgi:hypothetical protein
VRAELYELDGIRNVTITGENSVRVKRPTCVLDVTFSGSDLATADATVITTCSLCHKSAQVTGIDSYCLTAWLTGKANIQDVLGKLSIGDRETLLSGTHSACFDEAFPEDDDEECIHEGIECENPNCVCSCGDCPVEDDNGDPFDPTTDDGTVAHDSLEKPSYGS